MALNIEAMIDRRRLKRSLTFWRVFGVVAAVAAVIAAFGGFGVGGGFSSHIARLTVAGLILDDAARDRAIENVIDDDSVKALIVSIDSPGGTFVGGETLFRNLRRVAERKPVVAVMGNTAASAAYMIAIGADHIVANAGTITGSIGVIMQTADITGMLEKLGIKPETIKSGPLKAQPNPMEPFSPAARAATKEVIADLFAMFVDMVAARRDMPQARVRELADGRVYSGRQAKALGLIDAIGAETDALAWLTRERGIEKGLPVRDVEIQRDDQGWRRILESSLGGSIGKALFSERLRLDGVISVWHPGVWR